LVGSRHTAKYIEKKGADSSLAFTDKVLKDFREAEPAAVSPTFDTVGGMANALTLARVDQAVDIAKSYLKNIKFNAIKYSNDLAADGISSEQVEAIATLTPGPSLFTEPNQGINNLKLLRKVIEKDLTVEADGESNKFAERHRKLNQRILSARLIIGAIGTDEDLDRALVYLQTLHTEPRWPDFAKQLTDAVDEEAKLKFEAVHARAMELGGVQALTREDIEGLSYEQIRRLRGY
jgi:hypothetical protein